MTQHTTLKRSAAMQPRHFTCFEAAATSYCLDLRLALVVFAEYKHGGIDVAVDDVAERVLGLELSSDLRAYVLGWLDGFRAWQAPGGVETSVLDARSAPGAGVVMGPRGELMLQWALRTGSLPADLDHVRWYRVGWVEAVGHQHSCAGDPDDEEDE